MCVCVRVCIFVVELAQCTHCIRIMWLFISLNLSNYYYIFALIFLVLDFVYVSELLAIPTFLFYYWVFIQISNERTQHNFHFNFYYLFVSFTIILHVCQFNFVDHLFYIVNVCRPLNSYHCFPFSLNTDNW